MSSTLCFDTEWSILQGNKKCAKIIIYVHIEYSWSWKQQTHLKHMCWNLNFVETSIDVQCWKEGKKLVWKRLLQNMWYRESFNSSGSSRHVGRWTNTVICWPHSKLSGLKMFRSASLYKCPIMNIPNVMPGSGEGERVPAAVRYLLWLPVCQRDDFVPLLLVCETLTDWLIPC